MSELPVTNESLPPEPPVVSAQTQEVAVPLGCSLGLVFASAGLFWAFCPMLGESYRLSAHVAGTFFGGLIGVFVGYIAMGLLPEQLPSRLKLAMNHFAVFSLICSGVVVLLYVIVMVSSWFGPSQPPVNPYLPGVAAHSPGSPPAVAGVRTTLRARAIGWASPEAIGDFPKAVRRGDSAQVLEMLRDGRVILLSQGQTVLVLDRRTYAAVIQVVGGDNNGKICAVETEFLSSPGR